MTTPGPDRNAVTASVDVGGTFTDLVIQRGGRIVSAFKVPTTSRRPETGVLSALTAWRGEPIRQLIHATTLASNSLLDPSAPGRRETALVTTRGFRDVLEIGRQNRAELYDLNFRRPASLVPAEYRYELEERSLERGRVASRIHGADVKPLIARMKGQGIRSVAISFLHSYADPANERRAARWFRDAFEHVSVSSEVAPEPREYERTSTTVVNATLQPVVSGYLERLERDLSTGPRPNLAVMSSSGGLVSVDEVRRCPVQMIESGPAAGVIAAAALARRTGIRQAISFDMGGTTAKAGTITDGVVGTASELEVGGTAHHGRLRKGSGYPVRFPFVDLVEVSAGGGTVISAEPGGALTVGPRSAGALPGPACYGRGGKEPTLTDANLVLGILGEEILGGGLTLDASAAHQSLGRLGDPVEVAERARRLADLGMSRAIRMVTVERGLDPTRFALIAFGGAGPQHAADLAGELGIRRVVIPPHPGLFSALGLLQSDWKFEERMSYPRDPVEGFARLVARLAKRTRFSGLVRTAECRYAGQGSELTVAVGSTHRRAIARAFERRHLQAFGFRLQRNVEIVTIRAIATVSRRTPALERPPPRPLARGSRRANLDGRWARVRTFTRDGLARGATVRGPACIDGYDSTILIPRGWRGSVGRYGELVIRR